MDISLYIADLLDEHEYVIVPGLGAFVSSYKPAKFSDDKNTLLPPSRVLTFHSELKINDGLLTRYIAQQKKITLTQASGLLEKFLDDVLVQLELGEEVFIGNIGSLALKQEKLLFIPGGSSQENSESFGLQPLAITNYGSISEKKDVIPVDEKRKKLISRWTWIGLFLLFLLIALSLYFVFFTNHNSVKQTGPAIQKVTSDNKNPESLIFADSMVYKQNEIKSVLIDSFIQHPRKELYYSIGGSFRSQMNANEYFEKMSLKGFHPIQLGLIGNFYLVALDTFKTAKEAYEAAFQYDIYRNTEVWIFHSK